MEIITLNVILWIETGIFLVMAVVTILGKHGKELSFSIKRNKFISF